MLLSSPFCRPIWTAICLLCVISTAHAEPLKVVASMSILGDMVRQVGGEHVAVTSLVGPNGDTHAYEPTPGDVTLLAGARLLVINGLGLEAHMERLFATAGFRGLIATATNGIDPLARPDKHGRKGAVVPDPHAWQSLKNAERYVANIQASLAKADPAHAEVYAARAAAYRTQIADLDHQLMEEFARLPVEKRRVLTTHDAFRYFGRDYGVSFVAPLGISTEEQPSAQTLGQLIAQMKQQNIRAVFLENIADPRLIQRMAKEAGVVVGGALYSDALSGEKGPAATYLAMIAYNAHTLLSGMGTD